MDDFISESYSKTCVKGHFQKDHKLVFKTNYGLMQVKSIAECSKGSILQYFQPSLSYHLSLRSLFCLFLSGHFTQVLLYRYYKGTILQKDYRAMIISSYYSMVKKIKKCKIPYKIVLEPHDRVISQPAL